MELGVSHVQNLSSLTPIVDNIFDKYNKNLVPIRSLSDHDTYMTLKDPSSAGVNSHVDLQSIGIPKHLGARVTFESQ